MHQSTIATDRGQPSNAITSKLLVWGSALASWIAITGFIANIVKQDPTLIFLMTVVAVAIAGIAYRVIPRFGRVPVKAILIVFIVSLVLAIIAWSLLASSGVTPVKVNITEPQDGATVATQYLAKGTVSDPDAKVYVIVHPLQVSEMWVQRLPIVDGTGNWQAAVYVGTETLGIGERYELIALATNDNFLVTWATGNSLSEGQKLTSLPRKSNRSTLITVTRPK